MAACACKLLEAFMGIRAAPNGLEFIANPFALAGVGGVAIDEYGLP